MESKSSTLELIERVDKVAIFIVHPSRRDPVTRWLVMQDTEFVCHSDDKAYAFAMYNKLLVMQDAQKIMKEKV